MTYVPKHLVPYRVPRDYMGATYEGTYEVYGIHRDSNAVDRCNMVILEESFGEAPGVFITRASHWAVGWVDTLRVDPSEASEDTVRGLDDALERIANYPILDEMRLSEMEWDEACATWEGASRAWRVEMCQEAGISVFAARRDTLPEDPSGALFERLRT